VYFPVTSFLLMNHTLSTSQRPAPATGAFPVAWRELVEHMPIVILWRAARELSRQRAHRRAVLAAFRR
jgi:hypothetical protein